MPVATTRPLPAPVDRHRAGVRHVASIAERQRRRADRVRDLLRRRRFTGERRFVDGEIDGLDQPEVGGYAIAGAKHHEIARDELARRDGHLLAIAQDVRGRCRHLPECFEGPAGAVLLEEPEQHGEQHDHRDRDRLERVAEKAGDDRGAEQDDDQHVLELGRERAPGRLACLDVQFVRPVRRQAPRRFAGGESR